MKLASGVDLIEIARVQAAIARHGARFLNRIFTPAEIQACGGRVESLAARFAAKESAAKALGHGIGEVGWREIEVVGDENHAPSLRLHGAAERMAQEKGLTTWSLSLSHEKQYAIAFVVAVGN
jgi:holo-[acyl-carrier protein] synthase